jgi:hypothetical protein
MDIEKVEYINGNLFLMNEEKISIFRVKFYEDCIKFFNVRPLGLGLIYKTANLSANELLNINQQIHHRFTSFHYDTLNHFVYVGDDAGILYTFDIENGYMASAIIAHNNEIT